MTEGQRVIAASACALLLGLGGCEALTPRLAPVQSARIVQAEAFRQTFMVENVLRAERVFRSVLGPDNYAALSPEEWVPYVEKLMRGDVEATGTGSFVVSLMPQDHGQFFFEGWGHYNVVDRQAKQILVSGEFMAIDDGPHTIAELASGSFETRVRQTLQRHFQPERPSYVHEAELVLRVHVKRIDEQIYILDYGAGHEVGIANDQGLLEVTGCVAFEHQSDGRKLIDMRGVALLRDDYADKLEAAGFPRSPPRQSREWVKLGVCVPGVKAPHCACPRVDARAP